jgi:hypothetical protein
MPITTKVVSSNPTHGKVYLIQHYVIKFVSDLWQVSGFLRVLRFPPPIKLTAEQIGEGIVTIFTSRILINFFRFRFMVLNATFNNISVISWRSVLMEEIAVLWKKHRSAASHWQTLSHNVVSNTPCHERGSNSQH